MLFSSMYAATLVGLLATTAALPLQGVPEEIDSFTVPASPSGAFFDDGTEVLYVLAGTRTNGDHALYATSSAGDLLCTMVIPESAGMSRVDGFQVQGESAYIVDSQGPIYAGTEGRLGGSIYVVDWTDPCGCGGDDDVVACTETTVTWTPTVTATLTISALDESIADGGGVDDYFRNSGIVVVGDVVYAVNGVHPNPDLTCCYPKSLVSLSLNDTAASGATALSRWSFNATTIGHDVDMEALSCGDDGCEQYLYIGDEYNYVYRLNLATADPAAAVEVEWDLNAIVGNVPDDKGIESMTYNPLTGYFYVGIQETSVVHIVSLLEPGSTTTTSPSSTTSPSTSFASTSIAGCPVTDVFPACAAPVHTGERRVRREVRSLSAAEWDKVVEAMWTMKNTTQREGQLRYGPAFRSFDYLVAKHALAQTDTRGDQAHFGSWFATWHSAFVLEFELAVLSVDPTIGAIPYWDQTISSPPIFVDTHFGVDPTNATDFQVASGRFAHWPILSNESIFQELIEDYVVNATLLGYSTLAPTGFLRGHTNPLTTATATRLGSGASVETTPGPYDPTAFAKCITDYQDWPTWYNCIEGGFHSGPHGAIGGKNGDFEDPVTSPNGPIFFFHHANMDRSRVWWQSAHGDTRCDYYGYPTTGAVPTAAGGAGDMGMGDGPPPMGGGGPPARKRQTASASMDLGVNLHEVMSLAWGFTYADIGLADDPTDRSVQLTHADAICWLTPAVTSYTYDTLIDEYPGALDEPVEEEEEEEGGEEGAEVEEEENGASRPVAPVLAALVVAASLA